MGAYKSRPSSSCSEAWLRRVIGCHSVLQTKLTQDTSINTKEQHHLSDLQSACCNDDIDEIIELINDTNIHETTSSGHTLLHLCCMNGGCKSAVRFLSRMRISVNSLSSQGFTALHIASYQGDIELVSDLLIGGADAKRVGYASMTALHLACFAGHAQISELLLKYDANLHAQDALMFTPLHNACFNGHHQVVKCLINHNADVNMLSGVNVCPLHLSCTQGFLAVTELLIAGRKNNKADVNMQDNEKNTPLHYSARTGNLSTLVFLLDPKHGIKREEVNIYGDTALHVACYHGRFDVAKVLVSTVPGCLDMENIFSETPLHSACTYGKSMELVRFILKQEGVKINHQGRDGHTALHSACYHCHIGLVQFLIEQGASLDLTCNDDVIACPSKKQTCLLWAKERGHDTIVKLLRKATQESTHPE